MVARGCIVKNGGKCDGEKGALQEKAALWKKPHCGKAALWKIEKYAKKIWHASLNKPTPPFH
jgi:hypothetical protein